MAWRAYSERFLHHQATGEWIYTVPDGRRAVVTNIDVLSTLAVSQWVSLRVGPIYATFLTIPVHNVAHHEVMRVIAYQGEQIAVTISATGVHTTVSGYLFMDDTGNTGPPGDTAYRRLETPEPLPAIQPELA